MGKWEQVNIISRGGDFGTRSSDISGNYAIVGDRTNVGGINTARWYERKSSGDWEEVFTDTKGGGFGFSVAISGNYAVVSAPFGNPELVYVYERRNGTWEEIQTISSTGNTDFGVGLSIDGNYLLVGETSSSPESSHLYIRKPNGVWELFETVTYTPTPPDNDLNFGARVNVSGDNVLIGTSLNNQKELNFIYKIKAYEKRGNRMELLRIINNGLTSGGAGDVNGNYIILAKNTTPAKTIFLQYVDGEWKEVVSNPGVEQTGISQVAISGSYAVSTDQAGEKINFFRRSGDGTWETTDTIPVTGISATPRIRIDGNYALLSFDGTARWYQYKN